MPRKRGKKPQANSSLSATVPAGPQNGPTPSANSQQIGQTTAAGPSVARSSSGPSAHNYLLLVRLVVSSDPTITRILSVPANFTLEKVAKTLVIAFGWATGRHLSKFELCAVPPQNADGTAPKPVNRFLRKPLVEYHDAEGYQQATNTARDPFFMAMFASRPGGTGTAYILPKNKRLDEVTLRDVFDTDEYHEGKTKLHWAYDFGDGWDHELHFMGVEDRALHATMGGIPRDGGTATGLVARCLGGEGHPCAEDCGGEDGWKKLKEVFADPTVQEADGAYSSRWWFKNDCVNGDAGGLDPYKWDIAKVNELLKTIQ